MPQRDTPPSMTPRVPPMALQMHVPSTHNTHSVIGQGSLGLRKPARFHREEVAPHGEKQTSPQPYDLNIDPMQENCMTTCPNEGQLTHAEQPMQTMKLKSVVHPSASATNETRLHYGSFIRPELINAHFDRSRPLAYPFSPKQLDLPCHSLRELLLTYPPNSSSRDGRTRADMEWPLLRTIRGRNSELCPNTSSPPDDIGMESSDPNFEPANATRTTTPTNFCSTATDSCPSVPPGAPLSSTSRASTSPTSLIEKNPGNLVQCELHGPTAHSHFPLLGSQRNKHSTAGRRAQLIHNNVLKPKTTICRFRHTLGQARRSGSNVLYQDHNSEASMPSSICSEGLDDRGALNDYLNPYTSSMKMIAWNC